MPKRKWIRVKSHIRKWKGREVQIKGFKRPYVARTGTRGPRVDKRIEPMTWEKENYIERFPTISSFRGQHQEGIDKEKVNMYTDEIDAASEQTSAQALIGYNKLLAGKIKDKKLREDLMSEKGGFVARSILLRHRLHYDVEVYGIVQGTSDNKGKHVPAARFSVTGLLQEEKYLILNPSGNLLMTPGEVIGSNRFHDIVDALRIRVEELASKQGGGVTQDNWRLSTHDLVRITTIKITSSFA